MNTTHRILTHAGRVLLSAALIATLTLSAPPPPARAAIAFTNLGNLGMTAIQQGHLAWGDYDSDGDLDLVVAGCGDLWQTYMTRLYRNGGGTGAVLPARHADLPPRRSLRLDDFQGSAVVTPSEGVTIVGVCRTYDVAEGRALGYAGFALP